MTSDESVQLKDLSLDLHTSLVEKKPSLCHLSIESSSRSKGGGGQQMSPKLLNKAFTTNSHNAYLENVIKSV